MGKRSVGMRVLKFLLGTDQPSFVGAAAGVSIAWGNLVAFYIVYSGTRPSPALWQTIGFGLVLGLFVMPFLFMSISRASKFMSPWEALAMLAAAFLYPLALLTLGRTGCPPDPSAWRIFCFHRRSLPYRKSNCETAPFISKLKSMSIILAIANQASLGF